MKRLHQTLKPLLIAAGVRRIEEQIGRPQRFFQATRERDAMRLSDYFATCTALSHDPAELLTSALNEDIQYDIRPPRIVATARKNIYMAGQGIGDERLAALDRSFNADPKSTLQAIKRALPGAAQHELPQLLGIYGSALRIGADLSHAFLVLQEALEMAYDLELPLVAADLLIRMAYVALERQGPTHALRYAQDGTLAYTRRNHIEGQAKGFLAIGMFRYYSHDYREALRDLQAVLERSQIPKRIIGAHQIQALCWIELDQPDKARDTAAAAQSLALDVAPWIRGKLSWLEARLTFGDTRCQHLKDAQEHLAPGRPGDGLMVTIDLIEEYLTLGRFDEASQEIPTLCNLVENAGECRPVQQRVSALIRHRTRLTPKLVVDLRRALDRARDRRLSNVVNTD